MRIMCASAYIQPYQRNKAYDPFVWHKNRINTSHNYNIMPVRVCKICNYSTPYKHCFDAHMKSTKHMHNVANPPVHRLYSEHKYVCHECEYGADNKKTFATHKRTRKHQNAMKELEEKCTVTPKDEAEEHIVGETTLVSKKRVDISGQDIDALVEKRVAETLDSKLGEMITAQNAMITDVLKTIVENQGNTYNTNTQNNITQNNHVNLNLFITDKCKNAMNLSEFTDQMEVIQKDVEDMLALGGNPDAAATIVARELGKLGVLERPIHCTDVKRNTVYVKEDNVWTKDESGDILTNTVKTTIRKQARELAKMMDGYRFATSSEFLCMRVKALDLKVFSEKMDSPHIASRVHNKVLEGAVLNQDIAKDTMKIL